MLSSVFSNLFNDRVQHNNSGAPRVEVDAEVRSVIIGIRIADNGPGDSDTRRADVFGRGEQGISSSGTGIGLYLVEQ